MMQQRSNSMLNAMIMVFPTHQKSAFIAASFSAFLICMLGVIHTDERLHNFSPGIDTFLLFGSAQMNRTNTTINAAPDRWANATGIQSTNATKNVAPASFRPGCGDGTSPFPPNWPSRRPDRPPLPLITNFAEWEADYLPWLLGRDNVELTVPEGRKDWEREIDRAGGRYAARIDGCTDSVKMAALRRRPPVIAVITGDERLIMTSYCAAHLERMQRDGVLILRQYNDPEPGGSVGGNRSEHSEGCLLAEGDGVFPVWVIPLGFMAGMLGDNPIPWNSPVLSPRAMTPPSSRDNVWSFIGDLKKSDRSRMKQVFKDLEPHGVHGFKNKTEMIDEYTRSKFIVNGRGWKNLNCFRIYEAILSGAIPVVLGEGREGGTSYFLGPWTDGCPRQVDTNMLPWVVASSWEEAKERVLKLLDQPEEMDRLQQRMLRWWNTVLCDVRYDIARALSRI